MYHLSPETSQDTPEVEALMDLCFAPGRSALSSYRLREGVPPVLALCLVLRDDAGVLLGAIRYWPVRVAGKPVLLLGPVAVHPTTQGEGLGALLMRESLARADELGWARVMLVGDLPYYQRFGFAKLEGVVMPPPTNPDRVLGLDLDDGAWAGIQGDVERETRRDVVAGLAEIRRDPPRSQAGVDYDPQARAIIRGK
ncbi:GNAT family N-acetyltransferase [Paracoccus shanxieyensis]|uniref:GNAT family N-acetyltransferase n=1 Tax=Paracoccus shanxieyensis TaxID=2675752 RepID=A0A6L6J129_9RHOB|nr:N-acetyltransferase [Paracoccus shanxieyensis]MTH65122.1 GNAT family N-acetyltransferase [Paracoccus shanxieyensis]MTH88266.1 GNAT family N-acetyltransferase [Paracoccus shanxieyensis]